MSTLTENLIAALVGLLATLQGVGALASTEAEVVPQTEVVQTTVVKVEKTAEPEDTGSAVSVPFYSQFNDISDPAWKKLGCGIAGLAMLIEYYEPGVITVDGLLNDGINAGAFLPSAGWTHAGLIGLSRPYGLDGRSRDMAGMSMDAAFEELRAAVSSGPVMASVYYTFTPGHPIPHLVVINGIEGDTVYYNDPADTKGGGTISVDRFKPAWKKRYIEIRPV